ncbi:MULTISPECIES: hypothetical protein [unclassified Mycobacterium]|uniref:hypothetical protein n=1 Tax=unclassified Mycobacterium TaxID=2642494 RepID=UPI00111580FC|nr:MULTISPECIES: hypothetical protein [unclassified Mycobacterium]
MSMRFIYVGAAVGMAIAAPVMASVVLNGPSARADNRASQTYYEGCMLGIPGTAGRQIEVNRLWFVMRQDLNSGVPNEAFQKAEIPKIQQMGFDEDVAENAVRCFYFSTPYLDDNP